LKHSKSQPRDDKSSLKWAWLRHVIKFKFQGPNHISSITEATVNFVGYIVLPKDDILPPPPHGCGYGHVTIYKFCHLTADTCLILSPYYKRFSFLSQCRLHLSVDLCLDIMFHLSVWYLPL